VVREADSAVADSAVLAAAAADSAAAVLREAGEVNRPGSQFLRQQQISLTEQIPGYLNPNI
jgi:hypothetical protein